MAAPLRSDWLSTFLVAVEAGSFTAAAAAVHRSQSAVSLQIAQLEQAVGARLLERGARRLTLTAAGERLLPEVRRAVAALDEVRRVFTARAPVPLRLGLPEEYADGALPALITRLAATHPELELEVRCGASRELEQAFAAGELDTALVLQEEIERAGDCVTTDPTCWAISRLGGPEHSACLPVAVFDHECSWRRWALDALDGAGLRYRVVFSSRNAAAIRAAIRSGACVGVLGASTLTPDLRPHTLPGTKSALPVSTLALLRSTSAPAAATDTLRTLLREHLGRSPSA